MSDASGPLFDDWYIRIGVSSPISEGDTAFLVVTWQEPERDQRALLRVQGDVRAISPAADVAATLIDAYLISRGSSVRREISRLKRCGTLSA